MHTHPKSGRHQRTPFPRGRQGFALVITVVFLSLLVVLLAGLALNVRIETRIAANRRQLIQARHHALTGLHRALGELQLHAGHDRCATTRAAFIGAGDPNRSQWTGVWSATGAPPVWLVSSPPGTAPDPHSTVFNEPVVLVGPASAEITGVPDADHDRVRVEAVTLTVPAAAWPGWGDPDDPVIGRFAYWVGDEGVKPSILMRDERAAPPPGPRPLTDRGLPWGGFDFEDPGVQPVLQTLLAYQQLGYVDTAVFSPARMRRNYHRTTLSSLGVLANAAGGGLRTEASGDLPSPYGDAAMPRHDEVFLLAPPPWDESQPSGLTAPRFAVRASGGPAPAEHLLVAGAFNLNTSAADPLIRREIWRVILAAARTLRFPDGSVRILTDGELDALAAQFTESRFRAGYPDTGKQADRPFMSLADFVRSGLVRDALAATAINDELEETDPGHVSQDHVIALLAPILFVRSDTFVIRAYGEVRNPVLGTGEGEAWCEAVVQRVPDYVDDSDRPGDPPSAVDNHTYGRRFIITHFRWLTVADL